MNLEQARRLRDNADFQEFINVLKADADALKEDMLREESGNLDKLRHTVLTIRQVICRIDNLIEDLEEQEPARYQS